MTNHFHIYNNYFLIDQHVESIQIKTDKLDNKPNVTIAIPTYKRVKLLKESIDSAINQKKYNSYNIMIVDNNPERNDETELLIRQNYMDNKLISYYKNTKNIGMSGNWNRLYQLAKGEWVVMLHDDDILYDDYLYFLFTKIIPKYPKFDAYRPPMQVFNEFPFPERKKNRMVYRNVKLFNLYRRNIIDVPSGICMRKEMVLKSGGYNSDFYPASDYEFYVRNIKAGYNYMLMMGYPLMLYRISQNDSMKIEVIKGFIIQGKAIKDSLLDMHSKIYKYFWHQHFQISAMNTIKRAQQIFNKEANTLKYELKIKPTFYAYFIYFCIQIIVRTQELLTIKKMNNLFKNHD